MPEWLRNIQIAERIQKRLNREAAEIACREEGAEKRLAKKQQERKKRLRLDRHNERRREKRAEMRELYGPAEQVAVAKNYSPSYEKQLAAKKRRKLVKKRTPAIPPLPY